MNWDAIGASGEVFGAVVVVASVIYLGIQIKHNTKASRDEAYRDIFTAVSSQFSKMAEHHNNEVLLMGLADFEALTPGEKFKFDSLMCAWMTLLESSVISNEADLILDETMENWAHYMRSRFFCYVGFNQWWKHARGNFHPDAVVWVDRQIGKSEGLDFWGLGKS